MFPVLAHIDGISIETYVVATVLAFAVPAFLFVSDNKECGGRFSWAGVFWLCVGGEIGCRLYWQVQNEPLSALLQIGWLWHSGRVSYGGVIGAVAAAAIYCQVRGIPFRKFLDNVSPYPPLVEAIARLGCIAAGCCWGTPTHLPWAVQYPVSCAPLHPHHLVNGALTPGTWYSTPTHPVQLYSVFAMCALFVCLMYARKVPLPQGCHFLLYLAGYGAFRFVLEFWRGDCPRYFAPGFTSSQMLSAALAITASAGLVWAYRRMRLRSDVMA